MIHRYEVPEISKLWSDESKFNFYLEAELAILKALEARKKIPSGTTKKIRAKATIDAKRIDEIEKTTRHDVIAFCSSITEKLPPHLAKYFHYGVTSSDIIDTALSLQVQASLKEIFPRLKKLNDTLLSRAKQTKTWPSMGRSHGMFAEPLSFGQKLLGHWCEFQRRQQDYLSFFNSEITGQFSGAVGNYTLLTPDDENKALLDLGLNVEPVSTQVIPRDRLAKLLNLGALTACALERLATEIRHLHRSEVGELTEGFSAGQKGSSTMPHKKNPISAENISGLSRILRSHAQVAMENCLLWHERDISHSSAERLMLPDHFGILAYTITRMEKTLAELDFNQQAIESKVEKNFTYLSSYYLHLLIDHCQEKRDDLYSLVQKAAFATAQEKKQSPEIFHSHLMKQLKAAKIKCPSIPVPRLSEIKKIYMSHVGHVFNRALSEYARPRK